ncbi:hypothetical protein IDH44_25585 [Paenibacillus sp. IB182496]|uniref:PilZ domain-containing protein n=1 Tax=Paenibacillus sabuli TaxID=2772509 RepID=A0A927GUV6_9BACL|nr:hypothetical protein [Paenibacillus sabuli]MBD2848565.1 hypothetical protein [Paenibacillus sabuli]
MNPLSPSWRPYRRPMQLTLHPAITASLSIHELNGMCPSSSSRRVLVRSVGMEAAVFETSLSIPLGRPCKLRLEARLADTAFCFVGHVVWGRRYDNLYRYELQHGSNTERERSDRNRLAAALNGQLLKQLPQRHELHVLYWRAAKRRV